MIADRISDFFSKLGDSTKSLVKLAFQSRHASVGSHHGSGNRKLFVLGNGPSLAANIANDIDLLTAPDIDSLAVNFAGNTTEFTALRPRYYLLMDPHFFACPSTDPNVPRLISNLNSLVTWPMTLFIPTGRRAAELGISNPNIDIATFNPIGVEGFSWLFNWAISSRRGMPRPRNVLIPAIMAGIWMGYKEIYILGADHSWLKTLDVNEENVVCSVQPHFYQDGEEEHRRVATMFRDIKLHELLYSFHLAFKGYHAIAPYAQAHGVKIYNATPDSYIDAFPRRQISTLRK